MVNYRRNQIKGGTYFFTVTLKNRKSKLLIEQIQLLKESMQRARRENPYQTKAIVVLPDHLHVIWELPDSDANYSLRWRKIKSYFTHGLNKQGMRLNKNKHDEYDIWQRRFWEHTIRDEKDLENHIHYIHYNPIKHKLVSDIKDWPYSTYHHYIQAGLLKSDWASEICLALEKSFGER